MVARRAHNPEVGGSSPPSATTKTAVFLSKTAVFFGPMAKFRRYGRICVVICLRISYNHAMGREAGRATGGRLLSGTDQRHRFPVRISGRRYAGGGHAAVRLAAPVGAGYAYICAETAGRSLGDEERAGLRNRLSAIRETDTLLPDYYDSDIEEKILAMSKTKTVHGECFLTAMIEYEEYTEDELRPYFDKEFEERILPPVYQGKKYILDHLGSLYSLTLRKEEVMRKLKS